MIDTYTDVANTQCILVIIDCKEILKICTSIKIMYDIILFLLIGYFPEVKETLKKIQILLRMSRIINYTYYLRF